MAMQEQYKENDEAQTNDIASSWGKASHWSRSFGKDTAQHIVVMGRTCVRDYTVVWANGKPEVTDANAMFSMKGETVLASALKDDGWKRHKGTVMYNEITHEIDWAG